MIASSISIGLGLIVFEAVVHAKNLQEQYQSIIGVGNSTITYGLICLLANGIIRNDYYVKKQNMELIQLNYSFVKK